MSQRKESSVVESKKLGNGSLIEDFCYIGEDVIIGDNVHVYQHVTIIGNVEIGDNSRIYPNCVIGKVPDGAGITSRVPRYKSEVVIGNNCAIGPFSTIYTDVKIGYNVLIGDYASIRENCVVRDRCIIGRFVSLNYNVTVGSGSKIMDHSWMAGNMIIENDVFIGGGVMTSNDNEMENRKYDAGSVKGPHIKSHSSIGTGSIILPGLEIGVRSTVAAGSVVTRNVPDNCLVMGIPARIKEK